jgi:hypothetical protein
MSLKGSKISGKSVRPRGRTVERWRETLEGNGFKGE